MYDPSHVIPAECHSDDRCVEIQFDAQSYFEWSSDETLLELAECGFGSDYPADRVAEFYIDGKTAELYEYIGGIMAQTPKEQDRNSPPGLSPNYLPPERRCAMNSPRRLSSLGETSKAGLVFLAWLKKPKRKVTSLNSCGDHVVRLDAYENGLSQFPSGLWCRSC